jgi:hypothetical protein
VDRRQNVETIDPTNPSIPPGEYLNNRVYVEVHNRGITPAPNVQVMLLLADAAVGLPQLPSGYQTNVLNGTAISTSDKIWQTVGIKNITAAMRDVSSWPRKDGDL